MHHKYVCTNQVKSHANNGAHGRKEDSAPCDCVQVTKSQYQKIEEKKCWRKRENYSQYTYFSASSCNLWLGVRLNEHKSIHIKATGRQCNVENLCRLYRGKPALRDGSSIGNMVRAENELFCIFSHFSLHCCVAMLLCVGMCGVYSCCLLSQYMNQGLNLRENRHKTPLDNKPRLYTQLYYPLSGLITLSWRKWHNIVSFLNTEKKLV